GYFQDTWEWDGLTWMQRPTAVVPSARHFHSMAYDSQRQRTMLFGGVSSNNLGDTWEYDSRFLAEATPYGTGCGTPPLALDSPVTARPVIGTTAQAVLQNAPSAFAFMAVGWSDQSSNGLPLPLSLAGYGMPGCDLLQSGEFLTLSMTASTPGVSVYSLPIPNQVGIINIPVYLQAWAFAPAANAGSRLASNGLRWRIGNF
ncbi:MAG: hypothetical protein RL148_2904, partial [Planctomycetota bacterium]